MLSTSCYSTAIWDFVNYTNSKILDKLPEYSQPVKKADRKYLYRPMFAASPLSRVMMRHNRGLLEVYREHGQLSSNLAKRTVLPLSVITFTKNEKNLYDMLEEYCAELNKQIQQANANAKTMMGFLLNFFQLRFASSIEAIRLTLQRRLQKVELTLKFGSTQDILTQEDLEERIAELKAQEDIDIDETDLDDIALDSLLRDRSEQDLEWERKALQDMLVKYEGMHETPSKIQYLLKKLDNRIKPDGRLDQTVLFTRFLDSLHSIRKYLRSRNPNLRVGIYAGQEAIYFDPSSLKDVSTSHEEIKRLFRNGEIDLLLCTDAAAEGLNLQSADLLINFDLGWNPMKIEQRIGRIDRIGQKYNEIFVMNMCYLGSTEEIVYGRLWSRLQDAGLVVGTQQISLLPVEADDFRKLQEGKMTEEQLEKKAKEKIQEQRRINQSLEISAKDQYLMYRKLSQAAKNEPLPANLDSVWDALERASFMVSAVMDNEHHKWRSDGTDQYPDLCGTTDRTEITEDMPLLTWGNKRFDSFLTTMSDMLDEEYPGCVRRVVASHGSVTRVAWLAVNKQGEVVEINRYSDLKDLEIDTHASIADEQVAAYSAGMTSAQTGKNIAAMDFVLDRNNDFAEAQSWLVSYIATELLKKQAASGNTGANNAIKALEEERGQKGKRVPMPWKANEYIEGKYLFPANYMGNQVFMPVGELLYDCAVKRCYRAMSSIHKKKSAIMVDELLQNIRRGNH